MSRRARATWPGRARSPSRGRAGAGRRPARRPGARSGHATGRRTREPRAIPRRDGADRHPTRARRPALGRVSDEHAARGSSATQKSLLRSSSRRQRSARSASRRGGEPPATQRRPRWLRRACCLVEFERSPAGQLERDLGIEELVTERECSATTKAAGRSSARTSRETTSPPSTSSSVRTALRP